MKICIGLDIYKVLKRLSAEIVKFHVGSLEFSVKLDIINLVQLLDDLSYMKKEMKVEANLIKLLIITIYSTTVQLITNYKQKFLNENMVKNVMLLL